MPAVKRQAWERPLLHPPREWTAAERDRVAFALADGQSYSQIARQFCCSRNAVAGIAYRIKHPKQKKFAHAPE